MLVVSQHVWRSWLAGGLACLEHVACRRPGMFVVIQHVWNPQWLVPRTCLRWVMARLRETGGNCLSMHTSFGTALPQMERFAAIDCRSHHTPKPVQNISLHSPWSAEQRSALVAAVVGSRPGMFVVSQHVWSPQGLVPPTCLGWVTARLRETGGSWVQEYGMETVIDIDR